MHDEKRILFFGDLHGSFEQSHRLVYEHRPQAIVLLGDMQLNPQMMDIIHDLQKITQVWWIQGNHDTDTESMYDLLYNSDLAPFNLDGRVCEVAGFRIGGLGGIFRGAIWHPKEGSWRYFSPEEYLASLDSHHQWRHGLPLRQRSSIFPSIYMGLRSQKADILVCHEAPSCHAHGFTPIDRLAQQMGVKKVFHGHHHDRYDYSPHFDALGFEVYGVGVRGVTDLQGNNLRSGDEDTANNRLVSRTLRRSKYHVK